MDWNPGSRRAHRQHVFEAGRVADGRALGCVDLSSVEAGADANARGHASRRRTRDPHRGPRGDRVWAGDRSLVDGEPRDVDAHACRAGFRSGAVGVDHGACRCRWRCSGRGMRSRGPRRRQPLRCSGCIWRIVRCEADGIRRARQSAAWTCFVFPRRQRSPV